MRRFLFATLLVFVAAHMALAQKDKPAAKSSGAAEQVGKLDRQWFDAVISNNAGGFENIEADDIVVVNPDGSVSNKQQDVGSTRSGDLKFTSGTYDESQVRVYGDTAIVTGHLTVKGTFKGQDISGSYRFTDVFVKRGGKWQAVSAQITMIAPPSASK